MMIKDEDNPLEGHNPMEVLSHGLMDAETEMSLINNGVFENNVALASNPNLKEQSMLQLLNLKHYQVVNLKHYPGSSGLVKVMQVCVTLSKNPGITRKVIDEICLLSIPPWEEEIVINLCGNKAHGDYVATLFVDTKNKDILNTLLKNDSIRDDYKRILKIKSSCLRRFIGRFMTEEKHNYEKHQPNKQEGVAMQIEEEPIIELEQSPSSPVELRPAEDFRKLQEMFGDLDRLHELLKCKNRITVYVDNNRDNGLVINNDERDRVCYDLLRKAIEDSIDNLKQEVWKYGWSYSSKP